MTDAPRQDAPDAREALAWLDKRIETATANVARMDRTLPELEDEAEWDMCKAMRDADEESVRVLRFLRERVPSEGERERAIRSLMADIATTLEGGTAVVMADDVRTVIAALAPHAPEPVKERIFEALSSARMVLKAGGEYVVFWNDVCRIFGEDDERATPPQRAGVTEDRILADAVRRVIGHAFEHPDEFDDAELVIQTERSIIGIGLKLGELRKALDASRVAPQGGET